MSQIKKQFKKIKIESAKESGLSAFIERPVPTEDEINNFEKVVNKEVKQQEIDANLNEIYRDKKGALVDVKKLNIKKKNALIVRIFKKLLISFLIIISFYFTYLHFFTGSGDMSAVTLTINAPESLIAGEEFSYLIEYENKTKFAISDINLEIVYPENFVFISANPSSDRANNSFNLDDLPAGAKGELVIIGQIIAKEDAVNVISARLSYKPLNYSSEFKKEASTSSIISSLGFKVGLDSPSLSFLNQDNDISLSFFDLENNYFDDFLITFNLPENSTIKSGTSSEFAADVSKNIIVTDEGIGRFSVFGLNQETAGQKINFKYQVRDNSGNFDIKISLIKRLDDGQMYSFWEQTITPELVKNDLNLSLTLNDIKNNIPVDFSSILNYTLSYSNQGVSALKDVVIMAVLDGELFDFNTLTLDTPGEIRPGQIIWNSKNNSNLALIAPGDEGEISFSIKLKDYQTSYFGQNLSVSAYGQYGSNEEANKSNVIVSKLNSDFLLTEKIRYFDDNNIPVGSGPLPPKVGELSTFRVYWQISNNLHELSKVETELNLPSYINWVNNVFVSAGDVYYDQTNHRVIWSLGRLPLSVAKAEAFFDISLVPSESDLNKILVLSPGAAYTAIDNETQALLKRKTSAKTTKLEDDEIANLNNSGRIE